MSGENNGETTGANKRFSELWKAISPYQALIGFALPLLVYATFYVYELGYGSYFKVPMGFVSFSLPSMFATGVILLSGAFTFAAFMGNYFSAKGLRNLNEIEVLLRNLFTLLVLSVILGYYYQYATFVTWAAWAVTSYVLLRHIIMPLVWHRKIDGLDNKYEYHIKKVIKKTDTYTEYLVNFSVYKFAFPVILFLGLLIFFFQFGVYRAASQEMFFTYKYNQINYLAVRQLDEKVVLVDYKDNKIGNKLKLLNMTAPDVELVHRKLGRMKNS